MKPISAPNDAPLHIWVVTQYYPPEPGAPSARLSGLARHWKSAGHNPTILTAIPNHPNGIVPEDYCSKPSYFTEEMSGIPVRRHSLYIAPNKGKFRRVLSMVSFAASVLFYNLFTPRGEKPDVVMASSPSFFCVFSGWLLARRYGAKFVFEVRDLWPAIFLQMGILQRGFIYRVLEGMEMFLYRRADAIVTVTQSFAHQIAARGIKPSKLWVVFNGVADDNITEAQSAREHATTIRGKLGLSPLAKVILYIGNHGEAQALGQIIDAARLMIKRTDVVFAFVGQGADKEKLEAYARGVPNVRFFPSVPAGDVWGYYAMADINLVCLKNIPDFNMFIPSKMFEIMAAKSCAVACLRGEGAEIMVSSGSALVTPPEEADKLAAALTVLLDDPDRRAEMAESGHTFVKQHFLHSRLAAQYVGLFEKLRDKKTTPKNLPPQPLSKA
ncbi:MAG: glycosyltransferase WbuB [Alphaproteobacteria bacterium CG_4_10_14_0_8_um_filter_53_9]|nr:MAG: glycosyltransferase WbuB [Alphaproteobacteria bacterium CG_4_10_14_0_8_um_filter_53_9]